MSKKPNSRNVKQLEPVERQRLFWEGMRRCILSMGALILKYQLDILDRDDGRRRQEKTEDGRNITQR